jgi:hypothetical protein
MVTISLAPPGNMGGRSHTLADSSAAESPLVRLPSELQVDIFARLPLHDLAHAELICQGIRPSVLAAWQHEIPKSHKAAIASKAMPVDTWKKAWIGQCEKLETVKTWGAKAAQACKALPDDLNPFDVETECNKWLVEEERLGNFQGPKTLEEVFDAFAQNESELDLSDCGLHSLPPFLDKIKTLQGLALENTQLGAIDLKDLPELKTLGLENNPLVAIDLKDLPKLEVLYLVNNQLAAIDLKDLPKLEKLDLANNQLAAIDLKDLPKLKMLGLENNQLAAIDLKDLPKLKTLGLENNQLVAIDLKDLPELSWLDLENNQLVAINLKDLPKLESLHLENNQLAAIDLKDLPKLESLYLENNQLAAIDLKGLLKLERLYLETNQHHLVGPKHRHALRES